MRIFPSTSLAALCAGLWLLLLFGAGCSSSPEDLAGEMCDCVKEEGMFACAEVSQEHQRALADDREAAMAYASALLKCDVRP